MGKQRKKISDEAKIGTGKVTPVQVAFMVECYLSDHQYTKTLKEFREEASTLLSPFKSVPRRLMSLSAILNEYITLKEQQLAVSQEKARMDRLFRGLQDMVGAYQVGSFPAWFPPNEAFLSGPTLACTAPTISTPIAPTILTPIPGASLCKTDTNITGSDPRNIIDLEPKASVQEVPLAKRKISASSTDLRPRDTGGASHLKKARPTTGAGDVAKLQSNGPTSYSTAQEDLQRPTHLSSQTPGNSQTNAKLQDPQTPIQPVFLQENGSILQTNCSNDWRSDMTGTPCVVNDPKYSCANNSPVYASNTTSISDSCQKSTKGSSEAQGPRKSQKSSVAGDFNVEHIKPKKQTSKCRTLDFHIPVASSSSDPSMANAPSAHKQSHVSEDIHCQKSPELNDSFLEDFLSSEAVTPGGLSSLDDIMADLGDVSFSELLGDVIPVETQKPQGFFQPERIHEARLINDDEVYINDLLKHRDAIKVLAQLTDEDMNRQDFRGGNSFPVSASKNQQPYSGEKAKEFVGKENTSVFTLRDKKATSCLCQL